MARFFRRGKTKIYWMTTAPTNVAAPTVAEFSGAGAIDLSVKMNAITGFTFANSPIMTPDLATPFTTQIAGEDTAPASSMTFYSDDGNTDAVKTALAKGSTGYVVIALTGVAVGKKSEVWPATVTSNAEEYSVGNDPARFMVNFAITLTPTQGGTIA